MSQLQNLQQTQNQVQANQMLQAGGRLGGRQSPAPNRMTGIGNTFNQIAKEARNEENNNALARKGLADYYTNSRSGFSQTLAGSGMPEGIGRFNEDQFREYRRLRGEFAEKRNKLTRELSQSMAKKSRFDRNSQALQQQFESSMAQFTNMQSMRSAHLGRAQSVADSLTEAMAGLTFFSTGMKGGLEGTSSIQSYSDALDAARQANPNASEYELAQEALQISQRGSFASDSATFGEQLSDFYAGVDARAGGYGGATFGAGVGAGIGIFGGLPGLVVGTLVGGAVGGIIDFFNEGDTIEEKQAKIDDYINQNVRVDQEALESAMLLQTSKGMSEFAEKDSNTDRNIYKAMNDLVNGVKNGAIGDDLINQVLGMKESMGLDVNEIHASLETLQDTLASQIKTQAKRKIELGNEMRLTSELDPDVDRMLIEERALETSMDSLGDFRAKIQGAITALESADYSRMPENRLVTPEMAYEASKQLARGTLEGFMNSDGSVDPMFTDMLLKLPPEQAEALDDLMTGRSELFEGMQEIEERTNELNEMLGPDSDLVLDFEGEIAGLRAEAARENAAAEEERVMIQSLLQEIAGD